MSGALKEHEVVLGLDFDNTIISYDALAHSLAVERGLIPPSFPKQKREVCDHFRHVHGDE